MIYNPPVYNYIGSKINLLSFIQESIEDYTGAPLSQIQSVADLFCGTGAVTYMFLANAIPRVIANDLQYYAYILTSSLLQTSNLDLSKLTKIVKNINKEILNSQQIPKENDFISHAFTEHGPANRKYFTKENGVRIDAARQKIESLRPQLCLEEYNFLIKCLLHAVIRVSNITCVYGAYLKAFKENAKKPLNIPCDLEKFVLNCPESVKLQCFNSDIYELLAGQFDTSDVDVVYLDPPYSKRRYDTSYHVLETISLYDTPELRGITGLRPEPAVTHFSHKTNSLNDFDKMFSLIKSKYLFLSYSSDGNVCKEDMVMLLSKYFVNVRCYEKYYKRAKTNISKNEQPPNVKEYIFAAQRNDAVTRVAPQANESGGGGGEVSKQIMHSLANICDEFSKIAALLSKTLRN